MLRDPNWYALAAMRGYPLDDASDGVDDAGQALPPDLLVDARVRFPRSLGERAYVAAATRSPGLWSLVLAAEGGGALAAVSLRAPYAPHRPVAVEPLAPGVGGWVVPGPRAEPCALRYSDPARSRLLARCALPYPDPPVRGLRAEGAATALRDVVNLAAGSGLELVVEPREIDGVPVPEALVVRLADRSREGYLRFTGPCAGRPESGTCTPAPLESLGGVTPDCDGNIAVVARGLTLRPLPHGLAVGLPMGLATRCALARQRGGGDPLDECDLSLADVSLPGGSSAGSAGDGGDAPTTCADYFRPGGKPINLVLASDSLGDTVLYSSTSLSFYGSSRLYQYDFSNVTCPPGPNGPSQPAFDVVVAYSLTCDGDSLVFDRIVLACPDAYLPAERVRLPRRPIPPYPGALTYEIPVSNPTYLGVAGIPLVDTVTLKLQARP